MLQGVPYLRFAKVLWCRQMTDGGPSSGAGRCLVISSVGWELPVGQDQHVAARAATPAQPKWAQVIHDILLQASFVAQVSQADHHRPGGQTTTRSISPSLRSSNRWMRVAARDIQKRSSAS